MNKCTIRAERISVRCMISALALSIAAPAPADIEQDYRVESVQNMLAVLNQIRAPLKQYGNSARIYYGGDCQPIYNGFLLFPKVATAPSATNKNSFGLIKQFYKNNSNVNISMTPRGLIKIYINKIPETILDVRISSLNFKPLDQYNPSLAISAITEAPEVRAARERLHLKPAAQIATGLTITPTAGLKHLAPSLAHVTVDQALDIVAKKFGGVVFYGYCPNERLYVIDFAGGAY